MKRTYKGYCNAYSHLADFLQKKYHVRDMSFNQLTFSFIEAYDFYLRVGLKMKPNTVLGYIIPFRKIVRTALNKGFIARDPFTEYKPERGQSEHRTLTSEELQKIMNATFDSPNRTFIRDLFVFSGWTGLSYTDIKNLQDINIVTDSEGNQWIDIKRQKTGSRSLVPLLDIPKEIIKKYKGTGEKGKVFKMLCMNVVCQYTKRIGKLCGLDKKLTFHMSRHSFGTSICLTQGVPIETLSQMMGHRNIKTTQIYAEITGAKIEEDMQRLSQKIENKYQLVKS
ncbi:hypothetical protein B5F32_13405 [Parabacteroides distasonis]|uniref:Tyr recombinase domain-containing protein n=1 Tax=Parabacteroides distasonis TaxID=823 RepID=A0A1Y4IBJ6_PARDI|nr:hypothetical protein B5F32_13405 [Parabacteroides distasonis]